MKLHLTGILDYTRQDSGYDVVLTLSGLPKDSHLSVLVRDNALRKVTPVTRHQDEQVRAAFHVPFASLLTVAAPAPDESETSAHYPLVRIFFDALRHTTIYARQASIDERRQLTPGGQVGTLYTLGYLQEQSRALLDDLAAERRLPIVG